MKIVFVGVIFLIIPVFFLVIFVQGTYGRLNSLRSRCLVSSTRLQKLKESMAFDKEGSDGLREAEDAYRAVAAEYNSLCRKPPTCWVAGWFGFRSVN